MAKLAVGSAAEAYFVKLEAMLYKHGSKNGTTTPSLFRSGCRCRKSDGGGRTKTAHVAAFAEPTDSGPRGGGRRATPDAPRSRYRIDTGRSSLSRTRPHGAIAG